jgi:hypothetical protein
MPEKPRTRAEGAVGEAVAEDAVNRYIFVLPGGDYTVVTFADAPEMDFTVSRGATMSAKDVARLTLASKTDLKRWLKTGDVVMRPVGKE